MISPSNRPDSKRQHHPVARQEEAGVFPSKPHVNRWPARWSSRRRRDACLLLGVLLLGVLTIFALGTSETRRSGEANGTSPQSSPVIVTTVSAAEELPPPTTKALARAAQIRLYPFPQSNAGLMQPAVDARGNVWVGEMYANRLARLDAHTGGVTTWEPPSAKYGIMSTTLDTQGNVWFVEQGANYIGRFDPVRPTFRTFPLGTVQGHPLGPQDLQFDSTGLLWFTGVTAGRIGRLDPTTGAIQTWPMPAPRAGMPSLPFSLTVTLDGQIWFGFLSGGAVGHLDPITNHVTLYHLADPQAQVFSMAADSRGRIWFTEILSGKLGMVDPATNRVTELPVQTMFGQSAALYGLVVEPSGDVWFVNNGAGALVRYTPDHATYTFFQLSGLSGVPYGLTLDEAGRLWFTVSGSSANAVGEMIP